MEDRFFRLAIFISFIIHLAFFARIYWDKNEMGLFAKSQEVQYRMERPAEPEKAQEPEVVIHKIEPMVRPDAQIVTGVPKNLSQEAAFFKNDAAAAADLFQVYERKPERFKGVKVTKEVTVPMLRSEKINSPTYVTYYQIVRDRIRERAYSNYTKLSVGEVYLTFVIKSDGSLGGAQIMDGKSTANEFLREVGMKSVQEGAPFPSFPQDLNYPELTFNVAISFQYHEEE